MSTSLLYHAFGIQGFQYVHSKYQEGKVKFSITKDPASLRCPCCNRLKVKRHGETTREFKSIPIGKKPVIISFPIPRVECLDCNIVRQIHLGFADPRRTYTKSFERLALDLSKHMTILDVANFLDVSWDIIKDIQKRYLTRRFSKPKLRGLKQIAIDEISVGKGHKYLTVVLDLVSGAVVYVGNGKGADSLKPFWERLARSQAKIDAVAIDMSPAYNAAISKNLPKATLVFDHFHVIKLFNDKLSDFRRQLFNESTDKEKGILKGTRWLLLKNPENLNVDKNEKATLEYALKLNAPLAAAYYMKEELRQLWTQESKEKANQYLNSWINRAKNSEIKMLVTFAKTLKKHRKGITGYYDYPISTGPLEGTNNKIKTIQKQAYGFRDMNFFKLKICALHESKYALVG